MPNTNPRKRPRESKRISKSNKRLAALLPAQSDAESVPNAPTTDTGFKDVRTISEKRRLTEWADLYHANGKRPLDSIQESASCVPNAGESIINTSPTTPVKQLDVRYTYHHVISFNSPAGGSEAETVLNALAKSIASNTPNKHISVTRRVDNAIQSPTTPSQQKYININGTMLSYTADTLPDPPPLTYKTRTELEQLVLDWTSSALITLDGIAVPICFWKKLYSRTRAKVWSKIKSSWGKYRLFVAAAKEYDSIDSFWNAFPTHVNLESGKVNFTGLSKALSSQRGERDKLDVEKAKEEYRDNFDTVFGYKKSGQQKVLGKPHLIARRYRSLKDETVYWDLESDDEEE